MSIIGDADNGTDDATNTWPVAPVSPQNPAGVPQGDPGVATAYLPIPSFSPLACLAVTHGGLGTGGVLEEHVLPPASYVACPAQYQQVAPQAWPIPTTTHTLQAGSSRTIEITEQVIDLDALSPSIESQRAALSVGKWHPPFALNGGAILAPRALRPDEIAYYLVDPDKIRVRTYSPVVYSALIWPSHMIEELTYWRETADVRALLVCLHVPVNEWQQTYAKIEAAVKTAAAQLNTYGSDILRGVERGVLFTLLAWDEPLARKVSAAIESAASAIGHILVSLEPAIVGVVATALAVAVCAATLGAAIPGVVGLLVTVSTSALGAALQATLAAASNKSAYIAAVRDSRRRITALFIAYGLTPPTWPSIEYDPSGDITAVLEAAGAAVAQSVPIVGQVLSSALGAFSQGTTRSNTEQYLAAAFEGEYQLAATAIGQQAQAKLADQRAYLSQPTGEEGETETAEQMMQNPPNGMSAMTIETEPYAPEPAYVAWNCGYAAAVMLPPEAPTPANALPTPPRIIPQTTPATLAPAPAAASAPTSDRTIVYLAIAALATLIAFLYLSRRGAHR